MKLYQVTAKKLNKRKQPVSDFTDKKNVIGTVEFGFTFQGEEDPSFENALGKWCKDRDGYYYWRGGLIEKDHLQEVNADPLNKDKAKDIIDDKVVQDVVADQVPSKKDATPDTPPTSVFSDFWFNELEIFRIWNEFNEKGENAKALVLDSGINIDLVQIKSAIQEPVKNFVAGSTTIKCQDPEFHGTHCSSLIAARGNNQFTGAAPATKLYVGKITDSGDLEDSTTLKAALKEFLKDEYIFDIISISQTLISKDLEVDDLIGQHLRKNRIVIAAIGNDPELLNSAYDRYPGAFEKCISVGSASNSKSLSTFSMNPVNTNIFCFGENILSYQDTAEPKPLTGTSQATAIVAGICCLIVSWLKKNGFSYDSHSIKQLLQKYSSSITNNDSLGFIQPLIIFKKLQNFLNYENKNLQSCIDADHIDVI